ncbi:YpmA family protein [Salinibacillus xinjiangensis]|uniref:YpmA family protein n=1 Tax=Salinibacillus xinjiangensis TaxID=1229268 RepID=UPI00129BC6D8
MVQDKVETLSTVRVSKTDDLYKIVDCLNRTLKEKDLMFGLSLDQNDEKTAVFTIYQT